MQKSDELYNPASLHITAQKRAESEKIRAEQYAANQEKQAMVGQVAGKMAHNFNNILSVIMGNAEISLDDCTDPIIRENLELIFDQTVRGQNLTRNLVAFAKDQEPKQEFFMIKDKIDLVINLLKKDLQGIDLVNLIQNAVHALSKVEQPRISLRTALLDEDTIAIEIEDNGCGIPHEHIQSIFDPSFTLKGSKDLTSSYDPTIKGTGYGMSNVKKYITQHNGTIGVQSTFRSGTKITLCLPVVNKELSVAEKEVLRQSKTFHGKTILLVEDEKSIADVLYWVLTNEPCNHTVDIAENGKQALLLITSRTYDFYSLDYILPGPISGMDIYHYIRTGDKHVPILFLSGNITFLESIKDLKQKDPYVDHLSKPSRNIEYIGVIYRLFEKAA